MAKAAPALSNFNAGELSPDFAGRTDNEKYPVGCESLVNLVPLVQGPVRRRPGFRYVQPVKDSTQRTWLRKFVFSQGQAYQIEFGVGYCRFYTNHGIVLLSGVPYEVASPYTAAMLTNADNTCGLQLEQSGDVVYITCALYWTMQLTRLGPTNWTFMPYAPPDGPFLTQNASNSPALYIAAIAGQPTKVTCIATGPVFSPTDVATAASPGRLVRIGTQYFNTPPWASNTAYVIGDLVRFNGNTYKALTSATSGPAPPTQTSGTQFDGKAAVLWLYQDSGYGIGTVSAYTSATQVTLTLSPYAGQTGNTSANQYYRFPAATSGVLSTISAITQAAPTVVTTTVAHGYSVGDPVYLTGIGGMTQLSEQMYVITAVGANTFTLAGTDSTAYSAYTSGGTAIKNASLNWQIGAWGIGSSQYPGSFPAALGFYADRLFFGAGISWWGSAPGQYASHTQDLYSQVTSACAIAGIIAAQHVDAITWMSALNVLLIGTKGGEFGLGPITSTQALGPGNVQVARQSDMRSRTIQAQVVGTSNFYVQSSGKKVMAQDYNFYLDRYDSTNQNRLANHIAGYTVGAGIIDVSWHAEPYECLWSVRNDGVLIGYTFDRADNVTGWHRQPLGGTRAGTAICECVSSIPAPDGTRDEVWAIVKRTVNGATVRSVEYMEKDFETGDAQNTMCYVDMSGTYTGAPTTTIAIPWLIGETVSVLRDGGGHPDCVVDATGHIALQSAGSVVQVGLACPSQLVTMRLEVPAPVGTSQGKLKSVILATIRVKNTLGGYAGMLGQILDLMQPNVSSTALGMPPPLLTGDVYRMSINGDNESDCRIEIVQNQPFQMEILGIFPILDVMEPSP
jgi:hypothetical protein